MSEHTDSPGGAAEVLDRARAAENAIQQLCRATLTRPSTTPAEVNEDQRQRRRVERVLDRIQDLDLLADDDLHQAQEGLVTPLRHELGVETRRPCSRADSASPSRRL